MPDGPIRRAQLVVPFGVGAMVTNAQGISMVSGGLDDWFKRYDGSSDLDKREFEVHEWRLEKELRASHFMMPPDHRTQRPGLRITNAHLTVPFFRFPQWHFCPACHRLYLRHLTERGRIVCEDCQSNSKKRHYLYQVPFVAVCERGHIQDFPFREWVHRSASTKCDGALRLYSTGGASLSAQYVSCECGASRSLLAVTGARPSQGTTVLTADLDQDGTPFLCQGRTPWLGTEGSSSCTSPLRGALRGAANVYYPVVRNAIHLPRSSEAAPSALVGLLEEPPLSTCIAVLRSIVRDPGELRPELLRAQYPLPLSDYSDEQVASALHMVLAEETNAPAPIGREPVAEDSETSFRRAEYEILLTTGSEHDLCTREIPLDSYNSWVGEYFSHLVLVEKLRETRVLVGFTRVVPDDTRPVEELKRLLRRAGANSTEDWLPAYVVHGEGLFLVLNEERLGRWSQLDAVKERIVPLARNWRQMGGCRQLPNERLSTRFVLVHTLAHLLMNRLAFECGYGSAALRERLYVSDDTQHPMAALLLYTAAGDAEGTLGGLVRMGRPGSFEPVLSRALEQATWCSADPVCMEAAHRGGQGPRGCNLAACHNCALVSETACEERNRLLDRGLVIGEPGCRHVGYFSWNSRKFPGAIERT